MKNTKRIIIGILSALTISTISPVTSFATTSVRKVANFHEEVLRGPALKSGTYIVTVQANTLDIYKSMTSNDTIGKANKGDVFQILEDMGGGYAKVSYNDVEGYISIKDGDTSIDEMDSAEEAAASATKSIVQATASNKREEIANFAKTFVGGRYIRRNKSLYRRRLLRIRKIYSCKCCRCFTSKNIFRAVNQRYYSCKCRPASAGRPSFLRFRQICKSCCYVYRRR